MNLMPWLYLIEHKLLNLKPFQKLQLYLIPLCLLGIFLYSDTPLQANIQKRTTTTLQNHKVDTYGFIKGFEEETKALNIALQSLQEQNNGFIFELHGEFVALMHMVVFCETFEGVNSIHDMKLKLLKDEKYSLKLQLEFATQKYIAKDKEQLHTTINHLKNPFSEQTASVHVLKLYAIVNDEVLINHEWLHLNEYIHEYQLIKIHEQAVILQNRLGQQVHLEL